MNAIAQDADNGGGENIAAIIAAAVDAFLREEAAESSARMAADGDSTKISAWRMAARTESGIGARGYGASAAWRGMG